MLKFSRFHLLIVGHLLATAPVAQGDTFVLFEDNADWLLHHQDRGFKGEISLDTTEPYTGTASLRVTPPQGFVSGWNLPIRKNPQKGEYRYLTLAYKKRGGRYLVVHFGGGPRNVIHNTHAGWPVWWPSVELLREPPTEWYAFEGEEALDLFQLFGEFDLTYLSFAPLDGDWGGFDHVVLTSSREEACALLDPVALRRFMFPELEKRIGQWERKAENGPLHWAVSRRARQELSRAKAELRQALADLKKATAVGDGATRNAHRHLLRCRRLLGGEVARGLAHCRLASAWPEDAEPTYGVGLASTADRVFEDEPFGGPPATEATLELARNEYEGFQLVVAAFDRPLEHVEVGVELKDADRLVVRHGIKWSAVKSATSPSLRGALRTLSLEAAPVGCIPVGPSLAPVHPAGKARWPDPLLPNAPVDVPAGEVRLWFVTARAAEDCPPGQYQGRVTVRPANAPTFILPLTVRIWDFTLPRETHLKTAFSLTEGAVEAFYGLAAGMSPSLRREYYRFCLAHRLNPSNLYGSNDASFSTRHQGKPVTDIPIERLVTPRDEDLEFCAEWGMNLFNVTIGCTNWMDKEVFLKRLREFLQRYPENLRRRGLLEKAYIYCFDEPRPQSEEDYQGMRELLELVHTHAPELKRAATHPPDPKLYGFIDTWIPLISQYDPDVAAERRAAGEEVWWYVCNVPNHPFPNFATVEAPPIDGRVLPWLAWKYGVEGWLYHNLNWWFVQIGFDAMAAFQGRGPRNPTFRPEPLRWPHVPWQPQATPGYNGDGMLMYPGPEGRPLSSVRLVNIRDGLEDYEYLWLLRQWVRAREEAGQAVPEAIQRLLSVPPDVAADVQHYSLDPAPLLRQRRQVAEAIEQLAEGLKGPRSQTGGVAEFARIQTQPAPGGPKS